MTSSSLLPLLLLSLLLLLQPAAPQARKLLAPSPNLTFVSMIATAHGGNLRDPSPVVQDPATKRWHFWVDYVPLTDPLSPAGWHAFQWHYSAPEIAGPWTAHGLAFNHSARPDAWDHSGQLSPSVIYDEREQTWYYFYSATGTNYSHNDVCAQLVRASRSPDGPWLPLGTVAQPTGTKANGYSGHWNTLRLDSGRALIIGGQKGYWTKGCSGGHIAGKRLNGACTEGLTSHGVLRRSGHRTTNTHTTRSIPIPQTPPAVSAPQQSVAHMRVS
jgi:hypothetical protein